MLSFLMCSNSSCTNLCESNCEMQIFTVDALQLMAVETNPSKRCQVSQIGKSQGNRQPSSVINVNYVHLCSNGACYDGCVASRDELHHNVGGPVIIRQRDKRTTKMLYFHIQVRFVSN